MLWYTRHQLKHGRGCRNGFSHHKNHESREPFAEYDMEV